MGRDAVRCALKTTDRRLSQLKPRQLFHSLNAAATYTILENGAIAQSLATEGEWNSNLFAYRFHKAVTKRRRTPLIVNCT
jgi:hypothetical protein